MRTPGAFAGDLESGASSSTFGFHAVAVSAASDKSVQGQAAATTTTATADDPWKRFRAATDRLAHLAESATLEEASPQRPRSIIILSDWFHVPAFRADAYNWILGGQNSDQNSSHPLLGLQRLHGPIRPAPPASSGQKVKSKKPKVTAAIRAAPRRIPRPPGADKNYVAPHIRPQFDDMKEKMIIFFKTNSKITRFHKWYDENHGQTVSGLGRKSSETQPWF